MRKIVVALAIGLLITAGGMEATVQGAAAARAQPKVVIVVGAVEGLTSQYRAEGSAAAAEFAKYTSNVVKVFSPNATWAAVQAAAQGASVLVYMGHGNGFPSPYLPYLQTSKDDGMGLNASAAGTDNNKQYYGEAYMAELQLAPNAVVILNHLCYSAGNSEQGRGRPTLAVAKARVDNFASGFLRGNARAVIAEALGSITPYIDALFTKDETLDQLWKSMPNFHNNVTSWDSSRNPGYTSEIDPNLAHPESDGDVYYRSMVSLPGLTTTAIGAGVTYAPTTYRPITAVRLLDTRTGSGSTGKLVANTPRTFGVAGLKGIPTGATAVTGNVTVVGPTNSWAVYLGPVPIASPPTSTINFAKGETVANSLTVALSSTGTLSATYMSKAGNTTDLVFDVTGYYLPDKKGDTYHPLTPGRLLDTRSGNGLTGKLTANAPRTFTIWGRGGVPKSAKAVTGNLTVVNSSAGWAVYMGPAAVAKPTTSTISFTAGQVQGNGLTVELSATGTLSATYISTAGNTTDLVFDVTGYYTADLTGERYVPLTPVRLLDTRYANGLTGKLVANTPRSFAVRGRGGVPPSASGVSGNVTVVNASHPWAIYLGPVSTATPKTSTVNFRKGQTKSNGLTVALSAKGALSATYMATAGNTTDLVLDVTGYFAP